MKFKKFGALLLSAVLCIGMAAPAFAFEGEAAPVEQPVLPEVVEEDVVTITDETSGALTPEGNLTLVDDYHTNYSDGSGQQFITLVSKSGATFYLVIYYPLLALSDQLEEDCADIIAEGLLLPECLVRASMAFFQFPDTLSHISRSQLDMNYPSFKKMARQLGVQRQLLANRMKYLHILTSDVPYRHTLSLMEAG